MTANEYQRLTPATECDYTVVLENLKKNPAIISHLRTCLLLAKQFGEQISLLKKTLFYGKQYSTAEDHRVFSFLPPGCPEDAISRLTADHALLLRFLHCPVGLCTEAIELLEMTADAILEGAVFDHVNAIEELGDSAWYESNGANALEAALEDIFAINIRKLRTRYPNKFSLEACENRDLERERTLLENEVRTSYYGDFVGAEGCEMDEIRQ